MPLMKSKTIGHIHSSNLSCDISRFAGAVSSVRSIRHIYLDSALMLSPVNAYAHIQYMYTHTHTHTRTLSQTNEHKSMHASMRIRGHNKDSSMCITLSHLKVTAMFKPITDCRSRATQTANPQIWPH